MSARRMFRAVARTAGRSRVVMRAAATRDRPAAVAVTAVTAARGFCRPWRAGSARSPTSWATRSTAFSACLGQVAAAFRTAANDREHACDRLAARAVPVTVATRAARIARAAVTKFRPSRKRRHRSYRRRRRRRCDRRAHTRRRVFTRRRVRRRRVRRPPSLVNRRDGT